MATVGVKVLKFLVVCSNTKNAVECNSVIYWPAVHIMLLRQKVTHEVIIYFTRALEHDAKNT